ncbi:MAG: tripartite tricarboxylate transporter TctB family protein [Rhodospirillaceae bacterium]
MNDRITVYAFLAFGVLMCAAIIPETVPVSFVPKGQIGPRLFPDLLAGAVALIAALILAAERFERRRKKNAAPAAPEPAANPAADAASRVFGCPKSWAVGAVIVGYAALMSWAGFLAASAAAVAAVMFLFGERRALTIAAFAVVVPLGTWAFAVQVLQLPLP